MFALNSRPASAKVPLAFEAPEACPTESELIAAVEARGASFERARAVAGQRLTVVIRSEQGTFLGTAHVHVPGHASEPREVRGETCGEVIDALAVVIAIALGSGTESPANEPGEPPPNDAEALPSEPDQRPDAVTSPATDEVATAPRDSLGYDPAFAVTLYLGAALGPVPSEFIPRMDAAFHMASFVSDTANTRRMIGPVLRARLTLSTPPGAVVETPNTRVELGMQSIGLGACWAPHYDPDGLVLLGCAEVGATFMGFEIEDKSNGAVHTETIGFGTIGPVVEAQYSLGSMVHVGAKLGADVLAGRFSLKDDNGNELFESWAWSAHAMLGAGVHF